MGILLLCAGLPLWGQEPTCIDSLAYEDMVFRKSVEWQRDAGDPGLRGVEYWFSNAQGDTVALLLIGSSQFRNIAVFGIIQHCVCLQDTVSFCLVSPDILDEHGKRWFKYGKFKKNGAFVFKRHFSKKFLRRVLWPPFFAMVDGKLFSVIVTEGGRHHFKHRRDDCSSCGEVGSGI